MIEINNLTTSQVDENFIRKIANKVLKKELKIGPSGELPGATAKYDPTGSRLKRQRNIELSIAFIGSGKMRKLNKKYRKKNRVTDVLAFQGLGEVVICLREVKKSAKKYKVSFEKELARVLIHGILHLLGYNHEKSEKEAKKMREKEEHYLKSFVREGEA